MNENKDKLGLVVTENSFPSSSRTSCEQHIRPNEEDSPARKRIRHGEDNGDRGKNCQSFPSEYFQYNGNAMRSHSSIDPSSSFSSFNPQLNQNLSFHRSNVLLSSTTATTHDSHILPSLQEHQQQQQSGIVQLPTAMVGTMNQQRLLDTQLDDLPSSVMHRQMSFPQLHQHHTDATLMFRAGIFPETTVTPANSASHLSQFPNEFPRMSATGTQVQYHHNLHQQQDFQATADNYHAMLYRRFENPQQLDTHDRYINHSDIHMNSPLPRISANMTNNHGSSYGLQQNYEGPYLIRSKNNLNSTTEAGLSNIFQLPTSFQQQQGSPVTLPHQVTTRSDEEKFALLNVYPSNLEHIPHFDNRPFIPLGCQEDKSWLSEFLCFIRSECIEVFIATNKDVSYRKNSKKVRKNQVGLRCRFCAHLPHRERTGRSSSFPSSIGRIYQSLTMMIRDHFPRCEEMPEHMSKRFTSLKACTSKGEMESKRYWLDSATRLGMVDTQNGIFLHDMEATYSKHCRSSSGGMTASSKVAAKSHVG